jgi:hypothetical protein
MYKGRDFCSMESYFDFFLQRKAKIPATWKTEYKEGIIQTDRSSENVNLVELVLDRVQWWAVILVLLNL